MYPPDHPLNIVRRQNSSLSASSTKSNSRSPSNTRKNIIMISVVSTATFYAINTLNLFVSQTGSYTRKMASQNDGTWPSIAWLLAFPNSGTFYTTVLTEMASGTTTATNYGEEVGERSVVLGSVAYSPHGPYRFSKRPFPKKYILTKNHCTGYCTECNPASIVTSVEEFETGCFTGHPLPSSPSLPAEYPHSSVKKVVHLLRNPYDNIVARFHFARTLRQAQNRTDWKYEPTRAGFRRWCADQDALYPPPPEDGGVLCHSELFQYVQWHNRAFEITQRLELDEMILRYEDYHTSFRRTVTILFVFLGLDVRGKMNPFVWNGGYARFFTNEEREAVEMYVKRRGSKRTNEVMRGYFQEEVDTESGIEAISSVRR